MDTRCAITTAPEPTFSGALESGRGDGRISEDVEEDKEDQPNKNEKGSSGTPSQNNPHEHKAQTQSSALAQWTCNNEGGTEKKNRDWHSI